MFKLTLLFGFVFFMFAAVVEAKQCNIENDFLSASFLSASYEITHIDKKTDRKKTNHLSIWRMGNQVALQYDDTKITEIWHKTVNQQVMLLRYFEEQKRGIEYQPGEIKAENHIELWQQKNQLVTNHSMDHLTQVESRGEGCKAISIFHDKQDKNVSKTLEWISSTKLVKSYLEESDNRLIKWKLLSVDNNKSQIEAFFDQRDHYQTTDYADIGDNESDPFLLKMVNLGFIEHGHSGFYDAAGNSLSHGHRH